MVTDVFVLQLEGCQPLKRRISGQHVCRLNAGKEGAAEALNLQLGQMQPYIAGCLDNLSAAIQQQALADVNDWLVMPNAAFASGFMTIWHSVFAIAA